MELAELQAAWRQLDARAALQSQLQWAALSERMLTKARDRLRPLRLWLVLQIALGVSMMGAAVQFGLHRWPDAVWISCAGLIYAWGLQWVVTAARGLYWARRFGYDDGVAQAQQQLAGLRLWSVRSGWAFAVSSSIGWVPLTLMVFEAAFGADLLRHAPGVVAWFAFSAIACLGMVAWLWRLSRQPGREGFAEHVREQLAGYSVRRAQAVLDELQRFSRG